MTVKNLIDALSKLPPDAEVFSYYDGMEPRTKEVYQRPDGAVVISHETGAAAEMDGMPERGGQNTVIATEAT